MGDAVALAARAVAVERDRALPVEVHRGLVAVEVVEDRRQGLSAVEYLAGLGTLPVHVDDEVGVLREQRLLSFGVAAIGAMGVGVDELADREPVRLLTRRYLGVNHHVSLYLGGHRDGAMCGDRAATVQAPIAVGAPSQDDRR